MNARQPATAPTLLQPPSELPPLAAATPLRRGGGAPEGETPAWEVLESRLGGRHLRRRLGLERSLEPALRPREGGPANLLDRSPVAWLIRCGLAATGTLARGRRNALRIEVRRNEVTVAGLPHVFDGFTVLQLSDLHGDGDPELIDALIKVIRPLDYDACVLTGDYRARMFGCCRAALAALERVRVDLKGEAYAVLGNHDSIRMVPAMEAMGYRLLVNERARIARGEEAIYVAGIDDAHFFRMDDCRRAAQDIPPRSVSILLSHTPEAYRDAHRAGFDLLLCGHTHGGQICLPGGVPLLTEARCPRRLTRGAWRYGDMAGYTSTGVGTSVVAARFNCPPEVTLHRLRRAAHPAAGAQ